MSQNSKVHNQILTMVKNDSELQKALQKNPLDGTEKLVQELRKTQPAYYNDPWLYRIAIGILGGAILLALGGVFAMAMQAEAILEVPDIVVSIGSSAVAALAALFAPSPISSGE